MGNDSLEFAIKHAHGTTTLDSGVPDDSELFRDSLGRDKEGRANNRNALCQEQYGRWVPGGDNVLNIERIVTEYLLEETTYEQAKELALKYGPEKEFLHALSRRRARERED